MSDVLNRTTRDHRISQNTPDFPVADWIINPDLSAVVGFPTQYWIITGDVVSLMDLAARDLVDAAEAAFLQLARRDETVDEVDAPDSLGIHARATIELLNKRDNFNTNRIKELQDRVQEMLDSTGAVDNMRTAGLSIAISATNTRPRADAVQDYKDDINAGGSDT